MKKHQRERKRCNKINIQSNDSMYFSFDTSQYLFTKICVPENEMKCFVFFGGLMFKIFRGSQIPMTTRGFCTEPGVIEIERREMFLYFIHLHCYMLILLF